QHIEPYSFPPSFSRFWFGQVEQIHIFGFNARVSRQHPPFKVFAPFRLFQIILTLVMEYARIETLEVCTLGFCQALNRNKFLVFSFHKETPFELLSLISRGSNKRVYIHSREN